MPTKYGTKSLYEIIDPRIFYDTQERNTILCESDAEATLHIAEYSAKNPWVDLYKIGEWNDAGTEYRMVTPKLIK